MNGELEKNYVVQANELVRQTNWTMNKTALKLFKALVAKIDTSKPPKDNAVTVNKRDLVKFFDSKMTNYDYLKEQLQQLITSVKVIDDEEKQIFVALVNEIIWEKETENVKVVFSQRLMPYLIVTSHFLKYSADILPAFKSKYGLILFETLYSRALQYGFGTFVIPVSEIRWLTGTTESHKKFERLYTQVVKVAVDDINKSNTPILVESEKVKDGRKVLHIKFRVRKRTSCIESEYNEIARPEWL